MNLRKDFEGFDLPEEWSVYCILASGREELVASRVSLEHAEQLARQILNQKRPGVKVSLREVFDVVS